MKTPRPKKFHLPLRAYLLYVVLISALLTGITFSKYVVATTVGDRARVAILRNLIITETGNFSAPNLWTLAPGVDLQKQAEVFFEGSEMACYVFLEITASGWSRTSSHAFSYGRSGQTFFSLSADTGWEFLSGTADSAVYYRVVDTNTVLRAAVFANSGRITVSPDLTRTQLSSLPADFSIRLNAAAVQYHGFSELLAPGYTEADRAAAAWNAVQNK